jgi:CRP/FNR family nitrogen fixation transcriptional regulator
MLMHTAIQTHAQSYPASGRASSYPPPSVHDLAGSLELMSASMSFARNTEIFGEDEPADYLYKVVTGAVRTYKILSDGRRQVEAFHLSGDLFGLEMGDSHLSSAEAVTNSTVLVVKRNALLALAKRDSDVARQLWTFTARELQRAQHHMLLLIRNAQERIAMFLLEMAERIPAGNTVELPMSRQDIADYLGLTIETVSRTLTLLENTAAIEVPTSRRIILRNRPALNRLIAN